VTAPAVTTGSGGVVRLGTRRSALALAQARLVADALTSATGRTVELVEVTTAGDTSTASLAQLGGTGVFVSALRDALLGGRVDVAVHSLKDLPVDPAPGVVLAAVPERADPRDVLVASDRRTLAGLPAGATVGTGSPRRRAQLLAARPDLDVVDVRGNVDTRLSYVASGRYDAVVLAAAGLARLGRLDEATEVLPYDVMLPAPGQGALAVETRDGDDLASVVAVLDDPATRSAVLAERALLAALEAGCSAPVGALAEVDGGELQLRAAVADAAGGVRRWVESGVASEPEAVGQHLARLVLAAPGGTPFAASGVGTSGERPWGEGVQ
jgi:hydroxymethylbilane synthase